MTTSPRVATCLIGSAKTLLLLFVVCFSAFHAVAQKYSNEFLNIGAGARGQAMGNANTALTNDATAGYWNPAGLTEYDGPLQLGVQHSEWFAGIGKYDYLTLAYPLADKKRVVGFSFIRFGVDNIPNTLSLYNSDGSVQYDKVTNFSATDYAALLTYAQKTGVKGLSVGGNAKIIYRNIGKFAEAWGFGIDAGVQYRMPSGLRFGLTAHDLTTTFNAWSFHFTEAEKATLAITGNDIPIQSTELTRPRVSLGIGFERQYGKFGFAAEADLHTTTDGKRNVLISASPFSIDPAAGVELNYARTVFLRGGVNNFQKYTTLDGQAASSFQPNLGVGLKVWKLRLDYAYTNLGQAANTYSHVITLFADLNLGFFKQAMKAAEENEEQ